MEPEIASEPVNMTGLLSGFSLEALPKAALKNSVDFSFPPGTEIYLPSIAGADPAIAVNACKALIDAGYVPVPHLAARSVASVKELSARLSDLSQTGARSLMLIAGDNTKPVGPFASTLDILDTGLLAEFGFTRLGVAGHPDGLSAAEPGEVERALDVKARYAQATGCEMWIVTQFVFAADPVIAWMEWLRGRGIHLPVRVGIAGPAKLHTLVAYAMRCGVGNSLRFLSEKQSSARKLLGRWSPDELVYDLARHNQERPDSAIAGLHLYPFGGIEQTTDWLTKARQAS